MFTNEWYWKWVTEFRRIISDIDYDIRYPELRGCKHWMMRHIIEYIWAAIVFSIDWCLRTTAIFGILVLVINVVANTFL